MPKIELSLAWQWKCPKCLLTHYHPGCIVRTPTSEERFELGLEEGATAMAQPQTVICPDCLIEYDTLSN